MTDPPYVRDTGMPWQGQVPKHWDVRRIRHIAELRVSNVDKHVIDGELPVRLCNYMDAYRNAVIRADMPFMRGTARLEELAAFRIRTQDVLITKDSEDWLDIGVPAFVQSGAEDLLCGYHLAILRPCPLIVGKFLYWQLESPGLRTQLSIRANGVTRYGLSHGAIKGVSVLLPPIEEQRAIVRFLDYADGRVNRLIRAKRQLIALLNEQKQAIIHRAVTRGLDPDVSLKPSGVDWLGDIPEHWSIRRTKNLFRLRVEKSGYQHGLELLSIYTHIGVRPRKELEPKGNRASTTDDYWVVKKGDIIVNKLLAWMGAVGQSDYAGVTSPAYDILRPTRALNSHFFHYLFRTKLYLQQFKQRSRGIMDMRLRLYFDQLGQILLLVPPIDEQSAIVAFCINATAGLDQASEAALSAINLAREYRARLIADVVTGKLDVGEAAANLPEETDEPEIVDEPEGGEDEGDELEADG